ncbi:hypothetical protein JF66_21995 [Cryobacterium sp. MLB-32]|nr:hypothetical protein JF66_21995 [Cryobacterium sp. MLB-32]
MCRKVAWARKADRNMKAEFVWERKDQLYASECATSTLFLTLLRFSGITQFPVRLWRAQTGGMSSEHNE